MAKVEKVATIIRLPPDLKEKLAEQAQNMGVSLNRLIIKLLSESLED